MLQDASGRDLWIMDETGAVAPVNSHKDIQDRERGPGIPDWWVAAKDADWPPTSSEPETRSLLSMGAAPKTSSADGAGGGGIGYKLGKGGKDEEAFRLSDGRYARIGGLSGGHEVRGPVTPPPRPTAKTAPAGHAQEPSPRGAVTWDSPLKPTPSEQQLEPSMCDALHNVGEGKDLNVSSAYRPDKDADLKTALGKKADPHSEGRAVDINYVNGAHISDVANKGGAADAELRRQVKEMQARAENDANVQAFISPYGGFYRSEDKRKQLRILQPDSPDVKQHWNHVHIAVFKSK